jgi:DNA-binding HxlR family transcriptional regulator
MNTIKLTAETEKMCGVTNTVKVIGSKWTLLVIYYLCDKTLRFGELLHSLEGISPKTLSVRLKELEKNGIVGKKIYPQIPPRVDYFLTPKGQSLKAIITAMQTWGESA